eukprot:CAMPEP_0197032434 /NCGR_PEP_ID=MMETSP1384-20130603/11117_1 /TAXON_ID=29189 /ORGANISM="Ammonia sp." /LENGTH=65 /DNA_ID=CAMNT_0042462093 /DNA_START=15 /DNA_END=208 /DNA_ORIENTATION=+
MKWTKLNSLPCGADSDAQTSAMVRISKEEFMVAPHWPHAHYASSNRGLYRFNVIENKWCMYMKYS